MTMDYYEKRIEFIMEEFGCGYEAAERIFWQIINRTDEFAKDAIHYVLLG